MLNVSGKQKIFTLFASVLGVLVAGCGQITAEIGEIVPTEVSNPVTTLKVIYIDTSQLTLTEGSAAIINIAVDQKYSTETLVTVTMPDPTGRFQMLPLLVTIPSNTLSVPLTLQTIENATYQSQALFQLSITSAEANLSQGNRLLQITLNDNESPPASNHAPVIANNGPFYVLSGSSMDVHAASSASPGIATDSDNDAMILTITGTPSLGSLSNNGTSVVTYSPTATGVESLSVTITDGNGGSVSGTVLVHVMKPMTWTGATSTSWSSASNWCGTVAANHSACLGLGSAPGASDIAIIDNTCVSGPNCNPVVNSSITIGGLELSGHTLNQGASHSISVGSSGWVQSSGNFIGSDSAVTISGRFQISGSSVFQSTSNTLTLPGSNISVGNSTSFSHSNGVVKIIGGTGTLVWPTSQSFYDLSISFAGGGSTINLNNGTYAVLRDLTVFQDVCGSSSFLNTGTLQVGRNLVGMGGCTPHGNYLVRLNGSSAQAINFAAVSGSKQLGSLEIASTGTVAISESLNILGSWIYTGGTVDLTGSTLNFVAGGTIQPGNLSYNHISFQTTGAGSGGGYNLSAGTMKVYGDLQLATLSCVGGIASLNNGSIELYGTSLVAGSALASSCGLQGTANIKTMGTNHTLDASLASSHEVPNMILNHSGTLTLVGSPKFVGSYQKVSGSINPGTTTVTFSGGMSIASNGSAFYDLVIEGSGTTILTGILLANHDLFFDEKAAGGSSINGGTLQVGRNISNLDNLGITGTTSIHLQALGSPTNIHQNGGEFPKGNWTISSTGNVQLLSSLVLPTFLCL